MHYLFTLDELLKVDGFHSWFVNYDELKPVLDLFLMAYSDKVRTSEGYFLNLVQALECFHKRFVAKTIDEFRIRIEGILENVVPETEREYYEALFYGDGDTPKDVHLRMRLIDLLYADGQRPFILNMNQCDAFATKVKDTRNYYTHYDSGNAKKKFRKEHYPGINEMLMAILEYHIMVLLGFDASKAATKAVGCFNASWYTFYLSEECLG